MWAKNRREIVAFLSLVVYYFGDLLKSGNRALVTEQNIH